MERANGDNGDTNSSGSAYRYSNRRSRQRRPPRIRPNFFVGFRITSKELIAQIEELQRSIAQAFPDTASCFVDPRTLHVTLCVLHLKDMEAIQQASQLLYDVTPSLTQRYFDADAAPEFEFNGWRFFGQNDILITPLDVTTEHGTGLSGFAEQLHAHYNSCGLTTEPFRRPYSPHVTIWKTSRDRDGIKRLNHARNVQKVPPAEFTDTVQNALFDFLMKHYVSFEGQGATLCGRDSPLSIELLAMDEKEDDGTQRLPSFMYFRLILSRASCVCLIGYYKAYTSARLQHQEQRNNACRSLESTSSGRTQPHATSEL